jgi:hypothetical protein
MTKLPDVSGFRVGSTAVDKIYAGSSLVFDATGGGGNESGINGDNRFRVTAPATTTSLTAAVETTTGYWKMVSSPASSEPAAITLSGVQDTVNWSGGTGTQTFTRVADQNGRARYNVFIWPGGNYYVEWSGSEWRLIRHTDTVLATNSADEPTPPASGWSGEPNIAITYQSSLVFGSQWSQYSPYYFITGSIVGMPSGSEKTVEVFSCDANGDPSGELEYVSFAPSSQSITRVDASGCASLRGFRVSSSTAPSASWAGGSSLPSTIESIRAVGVAGNGGSYSQWGNYPANVSEGINVEGQQLDAFALNQLYTDLGTGTNIARIFVGGNPGTSGDDPTIATAKDYTVFGS